MTAKTYNQKMYEQKGYSYESLRMMQSEEGQVNAVFALFGSASQHAQFYELALDKFVWVYNKISNESISLEELEIINSKRNTHHKKTLGTLLSEFKKYVTIDNEKVVKCLENALQHRNFLIHHFFLERHEEFNTKKGRISMLEELLNIENELQTATSLVNGMRIAVSETLNLKEEEERDTPSEILFSIKLNIP